MGVRVTINMDSGTREYSYPLAVRWIGVHTVRTPFMKILDKDDINIAVYILAPGMVFELVKGEGE